MPFSPQGNNIYLGHIISQEGIKTDPSKIDTIRNYPIPKSTKELKSFLGLIAGYYRKFIENFSIIPKPFTSLLKKDVQFVWNPFCDEAFKKLCHSLITAPILQYPDYEKTFYVTCDASDIGIGAVLSQKINNEDNRS